MSGFQGIGRHAEHQEGDTGPHFGGRNTGFYYAGTDERGDAFQMGLGLYNSDNLDVLQATGEVGGWETDGGDFQIGAKGDASLFEGGFSLEDAAEFLFDYDMGGWGEFLSGEAHGPKANAEFSVGEAGMFGGAGAELFGGSFTVGGAEFDSFMFGTEISVGGGVGGVGGNFGFHWSDDDEDGFRELGVAFGGDLGIGVDISAKNEMLGRVVDGGLQAWDWLAGD